VLRLEVSYRGIAAIIACLALLWALLELWPVIILVLVSVLLMLGLLPFVDALVRRGLTRTTAVLLILVLTLGFIALMFSVMVPALIDESTAAKENLPDSAREIENLLGHLGINVELQQKASEFDWNQLVSGSDAVNAGQQALSITIGIITVIVMTAYLLADTPRMGRFIGQFIADDRKDEAERLFQAMSRVVGGYLRGQLITSAAIGIFTFVLLSILGVPNPLAFAVFAALADVVPLVGAFAATVPPTAAALQESATQALIVIVAMILYQQFEDRILVPRIYGRMLNLPPIIVLIAVLAGAELLGIIGVLLALPLTAAARVVADFMIENRRLPVIVVENGEGENGDNPVAPDGELLETNESAESRSTLEGDQDDQILAPDGPVGEVDDDAPQNGASEKTEEKTR
jgi:predicted PurR-regulated permease PerM